MARYPQHEPDFATAMAKMLAAGRKHLSDRRTDDEIRTWAGETVLDYIHRGLIVIDAEAVLLGKTGPR